jgi:hypothetical protein
MSPKQKLAYLKKSQSKRVNAMDRNLAVSSRVTRLVKTSFKDCAERLYFA